MMTQELVRSTSERLLAQLELIASRLDRLADTTMGLAADSQEVFRERMWFMTRRCEELSDAVEHGHDEAPGTAGAIDDLSSAVDTLEADIGAVREEEAVGYRAAVDRQLRAWKSRVESLRLQEALAGMEIRDELGPLGDQVSDLRHAVLVDLRNVADDARDAVSDVRGTVETLLSEVRKAVEDAAASLTKRNS